MNEYFFGSSRIYGWLELNLKIDMGKGVYKTKIRQKKITI